MKKICFVIFFLFSNFLYANELGIKILNVLKNQVGEKFINNFINPEAEEIYTPVKNKNFSIKIYKLSLTVKNSSDKKIHLFIPVVNINEKLFFTPSIIDLNTGKDLTVLWNFQLRESIDIPYLKEALIFKSNTKNKIVVFSDPECPYCRKIIPEIIKLVKKYNLTFYLYDYPLSFHKHAEEWSKFLITLLNNVEFKKRIDVVYDFYSIKKLDNFNQEVIKIAKKYNISENTFLKQFLLNKEIDNILKKFKQIGRNLKVTGTPSVFVNGKRVKTKKIEEIISSLN